MADNINMTSHLMGYYFTKYNGYNIKFPVIKVTNTFTTRMYIRSKGSFIKSLQTTVFGSGNTNTQHSPLENGVDYYAPNNNTLISRRNTNYYYIFKKGTNYNISNQNIGTGNVWGCGLVVFYDGADYLAVVDKGQSESLTNYVRWELTQGATESTLGKMRGCALIENDQDMDWGWFSNPSSYITVGNALMSDAEEASNDPYNDMNSQSTSEGGGGGGLDSVSGSDVNDPDLPSLSAVSTGLISIYTPTLAQLQSLGNFLWSDAFSVDTFKKIFSDPWDAILGLSILGVGVSGGTDTEVHIGNIDTDIYMPKLSSQYYKFNCGSIALNETWGSYLDYNPYTKVSIYLPFIGTHALNVDDIMKKTISLKYNIDILSGACVANIQCGGTVLYSFTGSCSATIPLSGSSYTNMINGILGVATSIGSMVATGGSTAPLAIPAMASSIVNGAKTDVSHSGNVSGMAGIMGVKSAYLIMEVPRICIPKNQDKYIGYPTYVTKKVGDLSGYCVFEDIKVRGNSHATMAEIEEIEAIMKEGVYL